MITKEKAKYLLFRMITFTLGATIAILIAEVGIRFIKPQPTGPIQFTYDTELGAIPVPLQKGRRIVPGIYDYTYSNNSYGLRGEREYSISKKTGLRILFLGDSFVYGIGVNDDQTFCYLIEKKLVARGLDVEVINAGNGGTGTDFALKFFNTIGYKFKSDIVVLCFMPNDFVENEQSVYYTLGENGLISPKSPSNTIVAKKNFLIHIPLYSWLISHSQVANLFKQSALRIIGNRRMLPSSRADKRGYSNEYNKKITAIFISQLKMAVENNGAHFVAFYTPSPDEVRHYRLNGEFLTDEKAMIGICQFQKILPLSLTAVLAKSRIPIENLYYAEGHFTPLAHYLASDFISAYLKDYIEKQ